MAEPVKGLAYTFPIELDSILGTGFQVNPTIAAGDFQISKDGGAFANLANLPTVSPAGSVQVLVALSASERDAGVINVIAKDVAGDEWRDLGMFFDIPVSNSQSAVDILEGDHIETYISSVINKKGTATPLVSKVVTGSLLSPAVTVRTNEP